MPTGTEHKTSFWSETALTKNELRKERDENHAFIHDPGPGLNATKPPGFVRNRTGLDAQKTKVSLRRKHEVFSYAAGRSWTQNNTSIDARRS